VRLKLISVGLMLTSVGLMLTSVSIKNVIFNSNSEFTLF
jgi:hypothetical protein